MLELFANFWEPTGRLSSCQCYLSISMGGDYSCLTSSHLFSTERALHLDVYATRDKASLALKIGLKGLTRDVYETSPQQTWMVCCWLQDSAQRGASWKVELPNVPIDNGIRERPGMTLLKGRHRLLFIIQVVGSKVKLQPVSEPR